MAMPPFAVFVVSVKTQLTKNQEHLAFVLLLRTHKIFSNETIIYIRILWDIEAVWGI